MADVDYTATVSMTTPANAIDDDFGLGLTPWDINRISQVLLPVLCAIFISVVIIVIACCLIQKKSKSSGVLRQKSSHTIETLHEVSDQDIYDVIDEFRVKNCSPDKFQSRHGKMDYNCSLTPHHHSPHSKLNNVFTNKSGTMSCQCASKLDFLISKAPVRNSREWMWRHRESLSNDARLSTNTDGGASSLGNDDDGIYETLDRHWTLKNEHKVHHSVENCRGGSNESGHKQSHADIDLNINEISENSSSQSSRSSQELQLLEESSARHDDARKLVCQISMFEISNEESKPALLETTYYQIQPQISQIPGCNGAGIPELFQKTNLRIVQDNMKQTDPNANLLLKPLKEDEVLVHKLSQSLVRKNSQLMKTTKIYEKLHKSNSKRVPTLLVKKSESFRTASTELQAAKEKNRISRRKSDSSDIEAPQINARVPTRHAHISAGPEATRILTKLGPLPPVPCSHKEAESKYSIYKSGTVPSSSEGGTSLTNPLKVSLSSSCLLKKQSLSLNRDSEIRDQLTCIESTNNVLCCPATCVPPGNSDQKATDIAESVPESTISCGIEITVDQISDGSDFRNSKFPSGIEIQSSYPDTASTESVCRVRTDRVRNSTTCDPGDDESNYYFVLEARDGTSGSSRNSDVGSSRNSDVGSSRNSGVGSSSGCYEIESNENTEVQGESVDRSSKCSIQVAV